MLLLPKALLRLHNNKSSVLLRARFLTGKYDNMLNLKDIKINDYEVLKGYLSFDDELSCENSFANLYLWHGNLPNQYDIVDDSLIIKTQDYDKIMLRIPLGGNMKSAMEAIYKHFNNRFPDFYAYEGAAFDNFLSEYGNHFKIEEIRDDFEYVYLTDDLIELSGKKYHSKRNHISAFSKKYNWRYESITEENIEEIKLCAKEWYQKNNQKMDGTLSVDKDESKLLLSNMRELNLKGGAIFVDDKVVAYTVGTAVNNNVFDIMIEKALPEYATAYAVINREFAANELSGYRFINREDDMGIDGLRKSKLSYKPVKILKKYICSYKEKL